MGSLAQLPQKCGRDANSRPGPASDLWKQILQAGSSYPCFNKPPDNSDAHSSLRARDLKRYKLRVEPGRINFKIEDILLSRPQGPMVSQRGCHQQTLSPLHRRRGADAGPLLPENETRGGGNERRGWKPPNRPALAVSSFIP